MKSFRGKIPTSEICIYNGNICDLQPFKFKLPNLTNIEG